MLLGALHPDHPAARHRRLARGRSAAPPQTAGTLGVEDATFGLMLVATIVVFGALTFFPAAALGPIAEHLDVHALSIREHSHAQSLHRQSSRVVVATMLVCVVGYAALILGIAQVLTPDTANGSLITTANGKVVGSRLIAQDFTQPGYFWPRPSARGLQRAPAPAAATSRRPAPTSTEARRRSSSRATARRRRSRCRPIWPRPRAGASIRTSQLAGRAYQAPGWPRRAA